MSLEFRHSDTPFCVIVKHTNPCGAAIGTSVETAYKRAVETDPKSYFGGIVGVNSEVDELAATEMSKSFLECIIAPSFSEAALEILKAKKNIRLVTYDKTDHTDVTGYNVRRVKGGMLVQEFDAHTTPVDECKIVTRRQPEISEKESLDFAWKMVKHVVRI